MPAACSVMFRWQSCQSSSSTLLTRSMLSFVRCRFTLGFHRTNVRPLRVNTRPFMNDSGDRFALARSRLSSRHGAAPGEMITPHRTDGILLAGDPAPSGFTPRREFVLLGQASEDIGLALALFGGQGRPSRRVLLPVGMAVDLRIAEDSGIDADWRTGQHGEIERVTRTGIDLDDSCRGLDNHHGIEDALDQASDS